MEQQYIDQALKPLKRKMHFQAGLQLLQYLLASVGVVSLLLALLSLLIVIPFVRLKLLYLLTACFPVALVGSMFMVPSRKKVMIQADNLGLKERVITAWYLKDDPSPVAQLQREDTRAALSGVNLAASYSIKVSKNLLLAALVMLLAAFTLSFIPGRVYRQTQLREALITEMKEQQKAIEEKVKEQQQKHPEMTQEQLQQLQEALEKLKDNFKKAKTEEDALKGLAQMENLMEKLQSQNPLQDLKEIANALSGSSLTEELADALMNEDEKALKEALEQLMKDLEDAQAQEELAELLENAASAMGNNPTLAEALQNLAASAATGAKSSGELTQNLSGLLEQIQANAQGQQAFAQAAGEIGKASSNARRAIAQVDQSVKTGQPGNSGSKTAQGEGNQPGSQGQGKGEGQGQGQGQGQGKGQGQGQGQGGGSGAGEGSTGLDQGYNEGDSSGGGRAPGSRKENEYQRIYVPKRLGGEGNESTLPGQKLESGSSTFSEADGAPVQKGSMVPWQEVLTEYREEAVQTMDSQDIPPGMKDLVRDYFSSLQ